MTVLTNLGVCVLCLFGVDRLLEEQEQARTKQDQADKLRRESQKLHTDPSTLATATSYRLALGLQLVWHG